MKTSLLYMQTIPSFLHYGVSHIRQSILDIDDSYNNEWDILAELIQNSVDAIRDAHIAPGTIELMVDCQNKIIGIKDNGIGIESDDILSLLALFGTNKKGQETSVGEKGVGLKFAIFSCNNFSLKTATKNSACHVFVKDAYNWKKGSHNIDLPLNKEDIEPNFTGTEIVLSEVQDSPIFDLSLDQLKYILRTRTAIGNTNVVFGNTDIDIKVVLNYISPDGTFKLEDLPFKYLLPTEGVPNSEKISIDEYNNYLAAADRDNIQKRQKLKNRIVYLTKKLPVKNAKNKFVDVFLCLVPGRVTWRTLNIAYNLATAEDLENETFLQDFSYATFQPGIFTSVKGMPTGVRVEPPITGTAGAWGSLFMLFDDRKLTFDIGRKAIHGKTQKIYQQYAREIFNDLRNTVLRYISGDITPETSQWDRDEAFAEVEALVELKNENTKFGKIPRDQEASVAAIFFECLGNNKITGITPLVAGHKNKYDLYALWEKKRVIIEFKSHLHNIIQDGQDQIKLFNEIDCVVCWDVSEIDEQKFKDVSIALEEIPKTSVLNKTTDAFPHSTHILRYSNFAKPIYVIDLKLLLKA